MNKVFTLFKFSNLIFRFCFVSFLSLTLGNGIVNAQSCNIIYVDPVSGNDATGDGQTNNPYKSLSKAISTNPSYIRVAKCVTGCTETSVVNLIDNVVIEGGYVRSGGLWNKTSALADKTIITFSGQENAPGGNNSIRHIVAFKSVAKSGWTVKDIDVITTNVPTSTFTNDGRGMSNYGFIIINNSSNYTLNRVNITVGSAGVGTNGSSPSNGGGSAGGNGGNGGNGCQYNCSPALGGNGSAGAGAGSPVNSNGGNTGNPGTGTWGSERSRNGDGGSVGANGNNGSIGSGGSVNSTTSSYFISGGQGSTGIAGGGGQGGGGGSGNVAGRAAFINCGVHAGASGGQGGQGGSGGTGGFGGGGSFGIWINNSGPNTNLGIVNILTGSAGNGGVGASGSNGLGGNGGGTADCNSCVGKNTCGGNGGTGGVGGTGGKGANGANGLSVAIVNNGSITNTAITAIPFISTITLDNYSERNNTMGKMCKNSEIDIQKTSGTWTLGSGLTLLNDLTSATSSYTTSENNIKVTSDNSNTFFDISNGTSLSKFLYTATDNRTLPTIQITPNAKVICIGNAVSLGQSNSYDSGNILEYEYIVFEDGSDANNPLYTSVNSTFTTPVINTTGRYWVRYRELHNCCGWSRPVFEYFDVIDVPNAPLSADVIGDPACFTGNPVNVYIQVTGTKAYSNYDYWELFDSNPAIGSPSPIQTSYTDHPIFIATPTNVTTYYIRGANICDESTVITVTALFNADTSSDGSLTAVNSTSNCTVNDNKWHYFTNSNKDIIGAINSNGQDLGNVSFSIVLGEDGPYGTGGDRCPGISEFHISRKVKITAQNTNLSPVKLRLFFTSDEYLLHQDKTNEQSQQYKYCYGITNSPSDLTVSALNSSGLPDSIGSINKGLKSGSTDIYQFEFDLYNLPANGTYTGGKLGSSGVDFYIHNSGGLYSVLPVELVSFSGKYIDLNVQLDWLTASEINNSHFDIERSENGIDFKTIATVNGNGTTSTPHNYQFIDYQAALGVNYFYRLNQVDFDGATKYSNIIQVNTPILSGVQFGLVYPNPANKEAQFRIYSDQNIQDLKYRLYDASGKLVFQNQLKVSKGDNQYQINIGHLPIGAYQIVLTSSSVEKTMSLIIAR